MGVKLLKKDIICKCLQILKGFPPIKSIYHRTGHSLQITTGSDSFLFKFEVKGILKRPLPLNLFFENISKDKIPLILAEYINSSIANELINNRVNFVDCQGNVFLDIPGKIYIQVKGRKNKKQKEKQSTILFNPKGLQLLTILLNEEVLLNNSLRSLQKKAGISLERTSKVINELKENGYILQTKKNYYKFHNKKELLEKWLLNFGERLRPKLLIGTYKISPETDVQKIAQILKNKKIDFALGGETGAEVLSHYYRAGNIDLFIPEQQLLEVIKFLKLVPASESNVRLFNLFTKEIIFKDNSFSVPLVLPILIYAELLFQENDRAIETADIIYNKYVKELLK